MKNKEYKTVHSDSPEEFDKQVNKLLDEGFELYGNQHSLGNLLCQPMTRNKPLPPVVPDLSRFGKGPEKRKFG